MSGAQKDLLKAVTDGALDPDSFSFTEATSDDTIFTFKGKSEETLQISDGDFKVADFEVTNFEVDLGK